ncbi:MAG: hypothetical protein ACREMY_07310 [bacterium]
MSWRAIPQHCANLECENRLGEGQFVIYTTHVPVPNHPRPVTLILCAPCAAAFHEKGD